MCRRSPGRGPGRRDRWYCPGHPRESTGASSISASRVPRAGAARPVRGGGPPGDGVGRPAESSGPPRHGGTSAPRSGLWVRGPGTGLPSVVHRLPAASRSRPGAGWHHPLVQPEARGARPLSPRTREMPPATRPGHSATRRQSPRTRRGVPVTRRVLPATRPRSPIGREREDACHAPVRRLHVFAQNTLPDVARTLPNTPPGARRSAAGEPHAHYQG